MLLLTIEAAMVVWLLVGFAATFVLLLPVMARRLDAPSTGSRKTNTEPGAF